jgi:hypothetical protein
VVDVLIVVQEMNRLMNTLILTFLCLVALVAAVVLWPFAVTALLALVLSGMKFNRWVSSGLALVLVAVWRLTTGGWIIQIGDSTPEYWYFEVLPGIVSWAIAAILVPGFAQWPAKFIEGYRSKLSLKQESSPKESDAQQAAP